MTRADPAAGERGGWLGVNDEKPRVSATLTDEH